MSLAMCLLGRSKIAAAILLAIVVFFPSYDERRAARATSVVDLGDDVSYGRFCAAEREVHAELDDDIGEPLELAAR